MRNWTFPSTPTLPNAYLPFTHKKEVDLVDADGVAGQNHDNPLASFGNHVIVRRILNETSFSYYDSSYGKGPWTDLEDWENESIDGFTQVFLINDFPTPAAKRNTTGPQGLEVIPTTLSY